MKRDEAIEWIKRTTAEDEDVYPLVGRDFLSGMLVRSHANMMLMRGVRQDKIDDALACAERMDAQGKKFPD